MAEWNDRTELLIGTDNVALLASKHVLVVGVGGVGAYAVETLVRAGIGNITIIDADMVSITNLNRQLPALVSTVGKSKVEVMKERALDINPSVNITAINTFISEENIPEIFRQSFDFVVDAIDSVAPKVALIKHCLIHKINIISSMGAGGRVDPTKITYANIWETYNDGLAKVVRTRLKAMNMRHKLNVVWSSEPPRASSLTETSEMQNKRTSYGTIVYLPAIFGCMAGAFVIKKLTGL